MITNNTQGQPFSEAFGEALASGMATYRMALVMGGEEIDCTIKSATLDLGAGALTGADSSDFEIGQVYTAQLSAQLYGAPSLMGRDIFVRVGVDVGGSFEYAQVARLTVATETEWQGHSEIMAVGTIGSRMGGPANLQDGEMTVANLAAAIGVAASTSVAVAGFAHTPASVPVSSSMTCREALCALAACLGGYAGELPDGSVLVYPFGYGDTYELPPETMTTPPELAPEDYEVDGLTVVSGAGEFAYGTGRVRVRIDGAGEHTGDEAWENVQGYRFTPGTLHTALLDPRLMVFDDVVAWGSQNAGAFFNADFSDVRSASNPGGYWAAAPTNMTQQADGWAAVSLPNASGTGTMYARFYPALDASPLEGYQMLVEVRDFQKSGSGRAWVNPAATGAQVTGPVVDITGDGAYAVPLNPTGNASPLRWGYMWFAAAKQVAVSFEARVSLLPVGYLGGYIPYRGRVTVPARGISARYDGGFFGDISMNGLTTVQEAEVRSPTAARLDRVGHAAAEAQAVAEATRQHFWHDLNGAHVTDEPMEDYVQAQSQGFPDWQPDPDEAGYKPWFASVINSLGHLMKTGTRYLAAFTHSSVAFYDGLGNAAGNIVARFGESAQVGKDDDAHVSIGGGLVEFFKETAGTADRLIGRFGRRATSLGTDGGHIRFLTSAGSMASTVTASPSVVVGDSQGQWCLYNSDGRLYLAKGASVTVRDDSWVVQRGASKLSIGDGSTQYATSVSALGNIEVGSDIVMDGHIDLGSNRLYTASGAGISSIGMVSSNGQYGIAVSGITYYGDSSVVSLVDGTVITVKGGIVTDVSHGSPVIADATTAGLVRTSPDSGIGTDERGRLTVNGRLGQTDNGGLYYPTSIEPEKVAANSLLLSEARELTVGSNRTMALFGGVGLTLRVSAAAGTTRYEVHNTYGNRFTCASARGGYATIDQSTAGTLIAKVTAVYLANDPDKTPLVPYSGANENNNNIVIETDISVNPDAATKNLRVYGSMTFDSSLHIGQSIGTGGVTGLGKLLQLGQNQISLKGNTIMVGNGHYSDATGAALLGQRHVNLQQAAFLAGVGHDTRDGQMAVAAVGKHSVIGPTALFVVGDGASQTARSNAFEVRSASGQTELVLKSPNGTLYKLAVDDAGTLSVTQA